MPFAKYLPKPPASPLSPWSSSPPQIPFPLSPPSPVLTAPPPNPIRLLGYRAATIRMRAEAVATSHSLPLPQPFILSLPYQTRCTTTLAYISSYFIFPTTIITPQTSLERTDPSLAGRLRFVPTKWDRQIRRDPERYVGYGITDAWDEIVETLQGAPIDVPMHIHVSSWRPRLGCLERLGDDDDASDLLMRGAERVETAERTDIIIDSDLTAMQTHRERYINFRLSPTTTGGMFGGGGDRPYRTCDDITGAGYCITGTAGPLGPLAHPELPEGGR
ncbi:hypothetical protein Tco_0624589 [Tanacetum coccineum]|uniref:Uncharacterized protein n=1 Tax=Tanacetum coccineum TaxID=301880 RepID=A0ABQ4WEC6_9ASTR